MYQQDIDDILTAGGEDVCISRGQETYQARCCITRFGYNPRNSVWDTDAMPGSAAYASLLFSASGFEPATGDTLEDLSSACWKIDQVHPIVMGGMIQGWKALGRGIQGYTRR